MRVRVLFFGVLKEVTGGASTDVELPAGATLGTLFDTLADQHPRLAAMASCIVLARNQEFAGRDTPVGEGDEVALLPPVSGGTGKHYFALTRAPIDTRLLIARLQTGTEGAVVTFEGTARNHTRGRRTRCLDYECYAPMALKLIAEIGEEIARTYEIERLAIVHRLGRILVGETAVAIVAMAVHRGPAFEAARAAIDRLKKRVPIWKKEHFVDGEAWVEGEWDAHVPVAGRG